MIALRLDFEKNWMIWHKFEYALQSASVCVARWRLSLKECAFVLTFDHASILHGRATVLINSICRDEWFSMTMIINLVLNTLDGIADESF